MKEEKKLDTIKETQEEQNASSQTSSLAEISEDTEVYLEVHKDSEHIPRPANPLENFMSNIVQGVAGALDYLGDEPSLPRDESGKRSKKMIALFEEAKRGGKESKATEVKKAATKDEKEEKPSRGH